MVKNEQSKQSGEVPVAQVMGAPPVTQSLLGVTVPPEVQKLAVVPEQHWEYALLADCIPHPKGVQ